MTKPSSRRPRRRAPALAAVAAAWLAALGPGCSERTINVQVEGRGSFELVARVGPEGGTVRVEDPESPAFGTEVIVPPGAVSRDTEMRIAPAGVGAGAATVPAAPFGARTLGTTVSIRTDALAEAVTVRLPYLLDAAAGEELGVLLFAGDGDAWRPLESQPADDGSRRLSVRTRDLGFLVAVARSAPATPPVDGGTLPPPAPDGGPAPPDGTAPRFAGLESVTLADGDPLRVTLGWRAASDERSPAERIRYRIYLPSFGTVGRPQGETPPGASTVTLPVAPGALHFFLVRAVDEAGNEDANLVVGSIRTPAGPRRDGGPGDAGPDARPAAWM
jgi:hypothetical protein